MNEVTALVGFGFQSTWPTLIYSVQTLNKCLTSLSSNSGQDYSMFIQEGLIEVRHLYSRSHAPLEHNTFIAFIKVIITNRKKFAQLPHAESVQCAISLI